MEDTQDETSEQSFSPCSSEIGDTFGNPEVLPRVGDEFQAEIPSLIAEFYSLQLIKMPRNPEFAVNDLESSPFGLPIPLMWSNTGAENVNGTVEFENCEESQINSSNEYPELKVEPVDALSGCMKYIGVQSNIQEAIGSTKMEADLLLEQEPATKLDQIERGLCPLPGLLGASWTQVERDGFLLGLYIYGKNLVSVKKFVESKEMGDILSFYYGEFYKSKQYSRWSESRKLRNRRSICGQRIFTGWRQQELLSRLFSHVSHECQSTLLEVCRTFAEGKISFEEYVSTLKSTVGINMLIEAVGIGKGNRDLTGISMEPVKADNSFSVRPEIPFGKACSSLASADIIRFLTGGFRLSKARSNDLFWEAVWPRLLARGWHSEQPKDNVIYGVKHSLVFLIPGVKKFSRRKLIKGNHYFDSITDVLNKVASDPVLLEVEMKAANGSQHEEECGSDPTGKRDQDGLSKKQGNSYFQPCNSSPKRGVHKFTIVDTSLANGAEQRKVRELRSLSIETACASASSSLSSESEEDTSEDSQEDKIETITLNVADNVTLGRKFEDSSDCANINLNNGAHSGPDPAIVAKKNHENENLNQSNDKEVRNMKFQFSRKLKHDRSKYLVPIKMQEEDNVACDGGESSCSSKHTSVDRMLNQDYSNYLLNSGDVCEDMACQAPPQNSSSACSLGKDSPPESNEGIVDANGTGGASVERVQLPKLIDLNKPPISPDFLDNEQVMTDMEQNNDNICVNDSSFLSETGTRQPESLKLLDAGADPEQQVIVNSRRQSTRNRPLTTKALEALEMGFFSTKKRKGGELRRSNSNSRSSRQVHRKMDVKNSEDDAVNVGADNKKGASMQVFHDACCPVEEP